MTLEEAAGLVGRKVLYRPPGQPHLFEVGVVTEVRPPHVFVRYEDDTTAKATRPEDLELEAE